MREAARAVDAEYRKIVTLPSIWVAAALTTGWAMVVASRLSTTTPGPYAADVLRGCPAYLTVGLVAVGVLATTQEYGSGQLACSLLAVPRRGLLVLAKLTAVSVTCLAVGAVAMGAAATIVSGGWRWSEDGRVTLLAAVGLAAIGVLAAGIGLLVRTFVASLATATFALIVAPPLLTAITRGARFLPSIAAEQLASATPHIATLTAATVIDAWLGTVWLAGGIRLARSAA